MVQVGDVVLASGLFPGDRKIRPAVVISGDNPTSIVVCPVSSKRPTDTAWITIDLHDFTEGGLDVFDESYVIVGHQCRIRRTSIVGRRKGRLSGDVIRTICITAADP